MPSYSNMLLVGLGGVAGANARFFFSRFIANRTDTGFPWGTLVVNVTGSFIMGLLAVLSAGLHWNPQWGLLAATGFTGAYTTYSTFEYETFALVQDGSLRRAAFNFLLSFLLGFAALFTGAGLANMIVERSGK